MRRFAIPLICLLSLIFTAFLPYPIDGFEETGIRRLARLQKIEDGEIAGEKLPSGALKTSDQIFLNFTGERRGELEGGVPIDPDLQQQINRLFTGLDASYSLTLMDITPGRPVRYAERKANSGYQPGSVGKLAVITALFTELQRIYPDSFEQRLDLLRNTQVTAGKWALPNEHTVPFYDPETGKFFKRTLVATDVFSLYEWVDHMLSVSSNGAASVVWREAILMRAFGKDYPVSLERANQFFQEMPRDSLATLTVAVVNEPLRHMGIMEDEWRLGAMFTHEAKRLAPGQGGSIGTAGGLMKFLQAIECGDVVDKESSLEIKRMMYMTDRRIRYAAAPVLKEAAVYFKSGSLYSCRADSTDPCGKYKGNVQNYMNSVAIIEHPDSVQTTYLVVLMSNVLRKNSASDHMALAARIDAIVRKE